MFTFIHLNVKGSTAWTCNLFPSQRLSKIALPKIEWKLNQPECAVSHCDGHSVDSMAGRSAKRVPGSSFLFLFFFPAGCFFSEKQPWLVTFTICILILLPNTLREKKSHLPWCLLGIFLCANVNLPRWTEYITFHCLWIKWNVIHVPNTHGW